MNQIEEFSAFLESLENMNSSVLESIKQATNAIFMESETLVTNPEFRKLYIGGITAYRAGDLEEAIALWTKLIDKLQGKDKLRIAKYLKNVYTKISMSNGTDASDKLKELNKLIYELEGSV